MKKSVKLNNFAMGYLEAAFFTGEISNKTILDIEDTILVQVKKDCREFEKNNSELLKNSYKTKGYNASLAGRDFWLTRNGHGAGFCRGLKGIGEVLTQHSKTTGESQIYISDDGKVYFTNLPCHRNQMKFNF